MAVVTTRRLEELQAECDEAGIEWKLSWGRAELFDALREHYGAFDKSLQLDPMKAIATKDMKSIDHLLTEDYACEPKLDGVRMRMFIGASGSSLNSGRRSVKTYCISPTERTLTTDLRWVQMQDLEVGDKLIAFEETGRWLSKEATVEAVQRIVEPCYRITTVGGKSVVASANHFWVVVNSSNQGTARRWRMTRNLRPGIDRLTLWLDPWNEPETIEEIKAAAYVSGILDGEGHMRDHVIGFSQNEGFVLDETLAKMKILGITPDWISKRENKKVDFYTNSAMKLLGICRPVRLLPKHRTIWEGYSTVTVKHDKGFRNSQSIIASVEYIGEQEVIGLRTSTGTLLVEGFLSHNSYTDRSANFPHLAAIGHQDLVGVILDGELISATPNLPRGSGGWTHSLLTASAALNNSKPDAAVKVQREHGWAQFHAFDILGNADGSTMSLPYRERRVLLENVMNRIAIMSCAGVPHLNLVPSVPASLEQITAYINAGYEGAMLKEKNSPYLPGKRKHWYKQKPFFTADAFIIGYVDGLNRNEGLVGGIKLAVMSGTAEYFEVAQCGNLTDAFRAEISNPDGSLKAEWYNRVIEFSAQCLTLTSNKARHPYMVRWRPDKEPQDCTMDQLDNFPKL